MYKYQEPDRINIIEDILEGVHVCPEGSMITTISFLNQYGWPIYGCISLICTNSSKLRQRLT